MREPTNLFDAYQWWRDALSGYRMNYNLEPRPGFYRTRVVKGGPFVPVAIWIEQELDPDTGQLLSDERVVATVNGQPKDPESIWQWCCAHPISEEDYRYYSAYGKWAEEWAPDDPAANPRREVDLNKLEPAF